MEVVINNMDANKDDIANQVIIGRDARFNFLLPTSAKK